MSTGELFEHYSLAPDTTWRPLPTSPKQKAIVAYCQRNGQITLTQATELVGGNVYHNATKHTGALLANMVTRGLLARAKPGVFKLP
jgi:hypothetical protein